MTVLIIDTARPQVWVALVEDGAVVSEKEWGADRTVGTKLLEAIEDMTRAKRPTRIAVHRGPGHFMSLRAGVVTAQLLAQGWAIELVEVAGTDRPQLIHEALDKSHIDVVSPLY